MSISRRISIQKMAESERRSSSCSSVQLYHLDKALDPAQLDKIIYQAGCNYATATTGRLAGASTNLDFDITGFSRYLASSKCLSVLLFWKEAEEYLNMFSQKDRAACAQKIFQRYLKRGAEFEVNLAGVSDATVEGIAAKLAKPPDELFAWPQECAYRMMALELFPNFWDAIKSQKHRGSATSLTALTAETNLKDVLGDEKEVTLFSEYCKSHFCEEQVLFWLEARDHKLLFDPYDVLSQGQLIFDAYMNAAAELRVNISDTAMRAVQAKLNAKAVDTTLFDEAVQEVETFLELDMWPRYKEAVISGAHDPSAGTTDVDQTAWLGDLRRSAEADGEVDLSKPSKAAVRVTLKNPSECERLRTAAARQGCAELVDYCRECAEYEKLFSDADRFTKAQAMHRKYLSSGCDSPVNIPDTQLKAIQKKIDEPTDAIFKKSYDEGLKLISDNIYTIYLEMQAADQQQLRRVSAAVVPAKVKGAACCVIS